MKTVASFLRRNPRISVGLGLLGSMLLFWLIGNAIIGISKAVPLSGPPDQPPSARYPLGTDSAGRQLLPVLIAGVPLTLEVGLLAAGGGVLVWPVLCVPPPACCRGTPTPAPAPTAARCCPP